MYIFNGFVYGEESQESIKIDSMKILPDRIMLFTFSNGETRLFDADELKGEAFEPLKDNRVFEDAVLSHGVVTWKNGEIDCAPEYMYDKSYEYPLTVPFR